MSRPEHVFIAHTKEDGSFADGLAASLLRRNVSVTRDAQLEAGDAWPAQVRCEMEHATAVVMVVPSERAPNRNSVWFEAGAAKALGKRVLAVRVSGERQVMPLHLADQTLVDGTAQTPAIVADLVLRAVRGDEEGNPTSDPYAQLARSKSSKARARR